MLSLIIKLGLLCSVPFIAFADNIDPAVVNAAPATTTTTTTATTTAAPTDGMPATAPAQPINPLLDTNAPAQTPQVPAPPSVPGSYNSGAVTDGDVLAAASFAVQQMNQGSLVKIVSVQKQVVAGINYKMQLIILRNNIQYLYNVVVFQPLPSTNQPMQLTNTQAVGQVPIGATVSSDTSL